MACLGLASISLQRARDFARVARGDSDEEDEDKSWKVSWLHEITKPILGERIKNRIKPSDREDTSDNRAFKSVLPTESARMALWPYNYGTACSGEACGRVILEGYVDKAGATEHQQDTKGEEAYWIFHKKSRTKEENKEKIAVRTWLCKRCFQKKHSDDKKFIRKKVSGKERHKHACEVSLKPEEFKSEFKKINLLHAQAAGGHHIVQWGVLKKEKVAYVTFRGSENMIDWCIDLSPTVTKTPYGAFVQGGMYGALHNYAEDVPADVLRVLSKIEDSEIDCIIFTGHSLGAGYALLTTIEILAKLKTFGGTGKETNSEEEIQFLEKIWGKIRVNIFGGPSCIQNEGSKNVMKLIRHAHKITHSYVAQYDVVPRLSCRQWLLSALPNFIQEQLARYLLHLIPGAEAIQRSAYDYFFRERQRELNNIGGASFDNNSKCVFIAKAFQNEDEKHSPLELRRVNKTETRVTAPEALNWIPLRGIRNSKDLDDHKFEHFVPLVESFEKWLCNPNTKLQVKQFNLKERLKVAHRTELKTLRDDKVSNSCKVKAPILNGIVAEFALSSIDVKAGGDFQLTIGIENSIREWARDVLGDLDELIHRMTVWVFLERDDLEIDRKSCDFSGCRYHVRIVYSDVKPGDRITVVVDNDETDREKDAQDVNIEIHAEFREAARKMEEMEERIRKYTRQSSLS
ncbi:hypothetical protein AAMO2058_000562100 [Amorphochlora amoebiformis]